MYIFYLALVVFRVLIKMEVSNVLKPLKFPKVKSPFTEIPKKVSE